MRAAVTPDDFLRRTFPDDGGAGAKLADHVVTCFDDRLAGREGDAAAAGEKAVTNRCGVGDHRFNSGEVDAQHFSGHHLHRRA